jgi:hypothetical protein
VLGGLEFVLLGVPMKRTRLTSGAGAASFVPMLGQQALRARYRLRRALRTLGCEHPTPSRYDVI